jgi:hypothetical protein
MPSLPININIILFDSSCHPLHTKQAIPYSLALRLRRICSSFNNFNLRTGTNELKSYLLQRGYNHTFLNKQIQRAANITRIDALQPKRSQDSQRIPFIVTYNPALPHISHIIHKHYNTLLSSERCKHIFLDPPLVAHLRCRNLRDLLVKSKLPNNTPSDPAPPPGSFRCRQDCATCPYIIDGLDKYTVYSTAEICSITSHITCNYL